MASPKQIQIQIDEVTTLMKKNMEDVIKRDIKLDDLTVKSEDLLDGSNRFKNVSIKLKRKMWWQSLKFTIIAAVIVLVLILIVSLIIWSSVK